MHNDPSSHSLQYTINKLSLSVRVKGIFTTGTTATGLTPSSDIDLVVILDKNKEGIKSTYTMIENRFADIFFFDLAFVKRCAKRDVIPANGFEGIFLTWLAKGRIEKDEQQILAKLQTKSLSKIELLTVSTEEKQDNWFKINYNYIANTRYFRSGNKLYLQALEIRLLYSVSELIVAYFAFRDVPWRGEKAAVIYLEKNDPQTYDCFKEYVKSQTVNDRYRVYASLFEKVMVADYQPWNKDFLVILNLRQKIDTSLEKFWNELLSSKKKKTTLK